MAQTVQRSGVLSSKYFLYATEFFAGMSVMAIELGASRLLAPYFSSSQIVWTIIIGTIMIACLLYTSWRRQWMSCSTLFAERRNERQPNHLGFGWRLVFHVKQTCVAYLAGRGQKRRGMANRS